MKKTIIILTSLISLMSCKKQKVENLVISADKSQIYPLYQTANLKIEGGEQTSKLEIDFGDGRGFVYADENNRFIWSDKVKDYTIKARALSKKNKVLAESNEINIRVEKFNKGIIGTYQVKDTCWDYTLGSLTYRDYQVTISDDNSELGDGFWIKNYGNIFPNDSVHYSFYSTTNNKVSTHIEVEKYPFPNYANLNHRLSLTIPDFTTPNVFVIYGVVKDFNITYQTGETTPYFRGNSTFTRI